MHWHRHLFNIGTQHGETVSGVLDKRYDFHVSSRHLKPFSKNSDTQTGNVTSELHIKNVKVKQC